jgi:hypothetical protein
MPAVSQKQANFMKMCAHSPEDAKKKCPPKKTAREFMTMDHAAEAISRHLKKGQ